ncbi:E3 ubiquitin-protein ligase RNF170-like isoform X1 [Branchiostoma lanceolatum]|uniref:E3 ubiquitin-protein ligase RNF170-like isoform X1 n=1 Tax=Branchiostoma lanceolatum TaxID=7740 RepID=UPI003452F030
MEDVLEGMGGPETGTLVEGIGDELVYISLMVGMMMVSIGSVLYRWNWHTNIFDTSCSSFLRNSQQQAMGTTIHPDHRTRILEARQQLGLDDTQSDRQPRFTNNGQCPICMENTNFAVETNCGHVFCANCILMYWRHGRWLGAVGCPVCRQTVTLLLPLFTEEENGSDDLVQIAGEINAYNRRYSGEPRPWLDYLYDLPTLLRHAFVELFTVGGLVMMFRVRVFLILLGAILYFISPLDIIPEGAFGILGLVDDVFVILVLLIYVSIMYRTFVANRGELGLGGDPE